MDQCFGLKCFTQLNTHAAETRGLRIPVATLVNMVAEGMETAEILEAYPDLQAEDIREALRFASNQ